MCAGIIQPSRARIGQKGGGRWDLLCLSWEVLVLVLGHQYLFLVLFFWRTLTDTPATLQARERVRGTCSVELPFALTGKINCPSLTVFTGAGWSPTLLVGPCACLPLPGQRTSLHAGPCGFLFLVPPFLAQSLEHNGCPGVWLDHHSLPSPVGWWGGS